MEDIIKKVLYTGVGLVTLTAEKLQETIDELVEKNKMSEEEGQKVVDDFQQQTASRKDELEERLRKFAQNLNDALTFPTKSEWKNLMERVEAIEAKLAEKEAAAPKQETAKKSTKKKAE